MIREGKVLEHVGDMIRVEFVRPADCGKCNACNGKQCRILLHGEANPGDRVEVEMPDTHMIKVSAMAYVIPLSMLLLGMLVFWALHGLLNVAARFCWSPWASCICWKSACAFASNGSPGSWRCIRATKNNGMIPWIPYWGLKGAVYKWQAN
ncbi:MAG TPA: SoxR reducing system RseC family protein [Clostridia bacterium]|nr:SoxR reducing system RseC family protein [Clostridia bacterium]